MSGGRVLGARPIKVGAIPNSGVPDSVQDLCRIYQSLTDQQQSTSNNCICRGSRAGYAAFLHSCHTRLAAWQSKQVLVGSWTSSEPFQKVTGILQNSASLREPGGAVLCCTQDCALGQRVAGADRWNTTLCKQVSVCPLTVSQYRH